MLNMKEAIRPRIVLDTKNNDLAYALKAIAGRERKSSLRQLVFEALEDKYPELKAIVDVELGRKAKR